MMLLVSVNITLLKDGFGSDLASVQLLCLSSFTEGGKYTVQTMPQEEKINKIDGDIFPI